MVNLVELRCQHRLCLIMEWICFSCHDNNLIDVFNDIVSERVKRDLKTYSGDFCSSWRLLGIRIKICWLAIAICFFQIVNLKETKRRKQKQTEIILLSVLFSPAANFPRQKKKGLLLFHLKIIVLKGCK